jgi:hypothetical protein
MTGRVRALSRCALVVGLLVAACGSPARPAPRRQPARFAAGLAHLTVAIVDVSPQANPRSRRQELTLSLTDAAGAVHVLYRRVIDGTCAIAASRTRRDDLEADAALIAQIDCPAARPEPVRVTVALDPDGLRVVAPEGTQVFAAPAGFDVVAGEPP